MDHSTIIVGVLGIIGTLAAGWRKTRESNARAVEELIVQIGAVRRDLEREVAARIQLQAQVDTQEDQLAEARSRAQHLEGQVHILTVEKQQAEKWATALAAELAELRRALTGGHSKLTLPPPKGA